MQAPPCFRTIAGFRSEQPEAFRNTFQYFVRGLSEKGLLGRKIVAIDGSKFRAGNAKKNNFNQKRINRRQQIIEHVFGTIKRQWGCDHILLKGLRKNDGAFGLIYLIYNLRRIINILGVEEVKKWVKKALFSIFNQMALQSAY